MEEHKLLALHESLSKLRKSAGLGVSSQYSWQKNTDNANTLIVTTDSGAKVRSDGLPLNVLYNNFVKEGSYDPNQKGSHGDGRAIKRDFSDCNGAHYVSSEASSSDSEDEDSVARKKARKEKRKAEKKAAKKAAKLEEKKRAKLEEKKRAKKEAKKLLKRKQEEEEEERPKKKTKKSTDDKAEKKKSKDESDKDKKKKSKKEKR